nr:hypothetical protein WMHIBSEC_WMHIBSEC_CDS_0024 [Caudoviricetes sp.]CAI9751706.1 hypothetical protein AZFZUZMX_AZFZUZMX_CDS_0024 [Caudoviricetes sp.]
MKRLLKKILRKRMAKKFGESSRQFEKSFMWVYNSPIREWSLKLHCLSTQWYSQILCDRGKYIETKVILLDRAKKLFLSLKKK